MKQYFGTTKTEFNKVVKKAVHQSNIEQANLMKQHKQEWKKEFDKEFDREYIDRIDMQNPLKKELLDLFLEQRKFFKILISSLLLSQRKEVIEECIEIVFKMETHKLSDGCAILRYDLEEKLNKLK